MSLRQRILLSYFGIVLTAAVTINWVAIRQITEAGQNAFFDDFNESSEFTFSTAEDLLFEQFEQDEFSLDPVIAELSEIAESFELHIMIFEADGQYILYDSEGRLTDSPAEDFYPDVAEVIRIDEIGEDFNEDGSYFYRSIPIDFDQERLGILRIGASITEQTQSTRTQLAILIGSTTAVGLLLVFGLGFWLANTLTRPLVNLRRSAQAMAQGALSTRAETDAPTEIEALALDFNQMAEAVEKMVAEQRAFASNAAHELRTPLTAIRLRTETLLEDDPDPALRQRYTEEIHSDIERLGRMIDDLRILSRVDSQNIGVGRQQVDINSLIRSILREFTSDIEAKAIDLSTALFAAPGIIEAEANHVRIALRNIIENSVKYTPAERPISIRSEQSPRSIEIIVQDGGIGIPKEAIPQLTKRFYRVDQSRGRAIPGSGLGLSLVESIMTLYQGDLSIDSAGEGRGTTVKLSFPLQQT